MCILLNSCIKADIYFFAEIVDLRACANSVLYHIDHSTNHTYIVIGHIGV